MLYGGGLCRMKRKDFKTSQYSCCSHGYTVKCISDIGLAIYGLYGQLIVDICVVMALRTLSPKVLQRVKVPSTCVLRSFHNWAFALPTVYLWPRTSRLTKILQVHIQLYIQQCTLVYDLQGHYLWTSRRNGKYGPDAELLQALRLPWKCQKLRSTGWYPDST